MSQSARFAEHPPISETVAAFLLRDHKLLIDGIWRPAASSESFEVVNPATGKELTRVPSAGTADVDLAVAAARRAFAEWAAFKPDARARLLWQIAELIEKNADWLAELESLDNGKPRHYALRGDIPGAAEAFRYYAGWCARIYGKTLDLSKPGRFHAYTLKEPVGVVGLIVPWNLPLLMASWKLAPALAAGCTCILKPAEETPLTALALGGLLLEAGVPSGVVNVLTGYGHTAGAAITAHAGVDKVAFTGSTEVGKLIVNAAAGNLKKVSLELGGKSPTIILPDAELDKAIAGAASSIFFNSGQTCAAGSRLYAHRSVFERVLEGVCEKARTLQVGPGHQPQTEIGPLISKIHWQRVAGYVNSAQQDRATLCIGGAVEGVSGYFFAPTVIRDVTDSMAVVREEIFGPVLVAEPFDELDAVIAKANDSIYGLTAKLWTRDISLAHSLARKLEAGSISINASVPPDPNVPFGGYKQSGWGRELGEEGLELFLQTKSVIVGL
jgi:phenylacetaldehyde dehydrogenase